MRPERSATALWPPAFQLTELGYGVQRIEATLSRGEDMEKVATIPFTASGTAWWLRCAQHGLLPVFAARPPQLPGGPDSWLRHARAGTLPQLMWMNSRHWCEQAGVKKGGLKASRPALLAPDSDQLTGIRCMTPRGKPSCTWDFGKKATPKAVAFKVMTKAGEAIELLPGSSAFPQSPLFKNLAESGSAGIWNCCQCCDCFDNARRATPMTANQEDW